MVNNDPFSLSLFTATEEKIEWYNSVEMQKLLAEYQKFHSHVSNLFGILVKKGVLSPDPYKKDNKISDITLPDDGPFLENERAVAIGKRLSDFESMLDFICNYFKFSISQFTPDRIRQLSALNNCFLWSSLVNTSPKPNTRGLAVSIIAVRQSSDTLSANVLNDGVQQAAMCVNVINDKLKDINDFQHEIYKVQVRKAVFDYPNFSEEKAASSPQEAVSQIKKIFPAVMGKTPYYPELIEEVIDETWGANKELLQKALLAKFAVKKAQSKNVIEQENSRDTLIEAILSLGTISMQLDTLLTKISDNKQVLENEHASFWDKIITALRRAFSIKDEEIIYQITVTDSATQVKQHVNLKYNDFYDELTRRSKFYSSFAVRKTPGFQKITAQPDDKILEFLIKQLSECQHLVLTLNGLDDFFKNAPSTEDKQKIRGLQMELTAIKNSLVKTNQRRAEYASLLEEQAQMQKLGITNED